MAPGKPRAYMAIIFAKGMGNLTIAWWGGEIEPGENVKFKVFGSPLTTWFDRWKLILFILLLTLRPSSETFL